MDSETVHYEQDLILENTKTYEDTTVTTTRQPITTRTDTTVKRRTETTYGQDGIERTTEKYKDTKKTYKKIKVTKYHKKSPEKKLEFTIDATQNLVSINAIPGLNLNANMGIGAVANRMSETGYVSMSVGANGQLTPKLKAKVGAGSKINASEVLTNTANAELAYKVRNNLEIFAKMSSSSLDAWSEITNMDRVKSGGGVRYKGDKWDVEAGFTVGKDLKGLNVLFKKNENYFVEGLEQAVKEISDAEAKAYLKEVY